MNTPISHLRNVATAASLCIALLALGCGAESPEKLISSGKAYMAKHDYSAAAIQFKNVLQKAPDNAEARYLLGATLNEAGDPVGAEIELRKAAAAPYSPDLVDPALARAMLYKGEAQKVVSEFADEKLTEASANADLQSTVGLAYLALGRVADARRAFDSAQAAQPDYPAAKLGLARIIAAEQGLKEATKLVDEVLTKVPSSVEAHALKADLLMAQGLQDQALQEYNTVLELDPKRIATRVQVISILARKREFDKAQVQLDALKKLAPNSPQTAYMEAVVAFGKGDLGTAKNSIAQVLKALPGHVPSLLMGGIIAYQERSYAQAQDYLGKVVARVPNQMYPRRLLVSTYLRSGQPERALEALQPLLAHASDDPGVLALAGETYLANNDLAKASQYYTKAASVAPTNAAVRTRLAQIRLGSGEVDLAIKDLESASAASPEQYQADLTLVTYYVHQKQFDKALEAAKALEKKQPDNPLTHNIKGGIYVAKRDIPNARASYERALQVQPTYFDAARNLAMMDLQDKKPELAKHRFDAILAKDPKNASALLGLAELLQLTRAPATDIRTALDKAVNANPASPMARAAQVNFLLRSGDVKAALPAAQQAQAALPDNPHMLELLGIAQQAAGDFQQAISTFGKLASALPGSPGPLLQQAQAYLGAKDDKGALLALQKALAIKPDLVKARLGIAGIQLKSGRYTEAIAEARMVQKQQPKDLVGYLMEAEVYAAQKHWTDAERVLRGALKSIPSPRAVLALHRVLQNAGRASEADQVTGQWMKEHPKDGTVPIYLAESATQRGDYNTAARLYRGILAEHAKDPVVLNNLAWVLSQLKDPASLQYAETANSLAPDNPAILDTLGWVLVENGKDARGLELLTKASELAPGDHGIRLHLAQALLKSGQKDAARKQLEVLAGMSEDSATKQEAKKLLSSL